MEKWYNNHVIDTLPIISSRIRLARNLSSYAFPLLIKESDAKAMMEQAANALYNCPLPSEKNFQFIILSNISEIDKRVLFEQHNISHEMLKSDKICGLLKHDNESLNIMLNEEDHIRIQSIAPSDEIETAWNQADAIDNVFEQTLDYAFKKQLGYLTACPTNTGTGLRASFMVHVPMLEKSGQLKNIVPALSKFGMTVRGLYGEGTEPLGSIYQISNQLTLGKSEQEIIEALKNVTQQIIDSENSLLYKTIKNDRIAFEDGIYRSLGVLANCRKISAKEAMTLLSNVRIGYQTGILTLRKPKDTIYKIMMNIQPGNLSMPSGIWLSELDRDIERATYLRSVFNLISI